MLQMNDTLGKLIERDSKDNMSGNHLRSIESLVHQMNKAVSEVTESRRESLCISQGESVPSTPLLQDTPRDPLPDGTPSPPTNPPR